MSTKPNPAKQMERESDTLFSVVGEFIFVCITIAVMSAAMYAPLLWWAFAIRDSWTWFTVDALRCAGLVAPSIVTFYEALAIAVTIQFIRPIGTISMTDRTSLAMLQEILGKEKAAPIQMKQMGQAIFYCHLAPFFVWGVLYLANQLIPRV